MKGKQVLLTGSIGKLESIIKSLTEIKCIQTDIRYSIVSGSIFNSLNLIANFSARSSGVFTHFPSRVKKRIFSFSIPKYNCNY
jgi:hypothetical protein